jgi:hypothetical protein
MDHQNTRSTAVPAMQAKYHCAAGVYCMMPDKDFANSPHKCFTARYYCTASVAWNMTTPALPITITATIVTRKTLESSHLPNLCFALLPWQIQFQLQCLMYVIHLLL